MGRRSAPGARATSNARAETSGSAPETDAGTRPAVARGPESGGWMPRKKRPSARASREWRDAGDALRTNHALASALRVATPERARDVLTAAVLCESLARGPGEADVRSAVTRVRDAFPSGAVRIRGVSVAHASARHGYLVADAPGAVFVACAGTRDARDLVTDVSVRSADLDLAAEAGTRRPGDRSRRALAAHGGFASRARGLRAPVRALFRNAVLRDGKRLVLCGHSLGGAVAALALLGLLLDIENAEGRADDDADGAPSTGDASDENENVKTRKRKSLARLLAADGVLACVGFAAPPPGDEATRAFAETMGWTRAFVNVCSREDFVPRLMLAPRAARSAVSEKALFQSEKSAFSETEAFGETPADGTVDRAVTRNRANYYASWRPAYAHVSPVHMVARDGAVTVVDARDARPPPDPPYARRGDERPGGVFPPLGPFSFSARAAREALAEHTMRAHRARLLVTCAGALAKARNDDDENAARGRRTGVWFARRFKRGIRGAGLGFGSRENGDARGGVAAAIGLPPPAVDALGAAPQPRPATATAAVERDGESRPSLLVTVRGEDLELCVGVAAETNGWPCAATLVATEKKTENRIGSRSDSVGVFVSPKLALSVRVYPPTLNGALVPAPLFGGGGDARDWSRVVVALRGDFGDACVAASVADASGFAEPSPFRSRL